MQPYSSSIDTVGGSALRNASVAVKLNGALATIYALDGSPQANPMTTDSTGSFAFRAANGEYTLEITRVGIVPRTETVSLYDPADDASSTANLAASSGSALVGTIASGTGAVARTVQAKLRESVSAEDFFVAAETYQTAMIQRAIDAVYSAGGGTVELTAYEYLLDASAKSETYDNYGSAIAASTGCLILYSGVTLSGKGKIPLLKPTSPTLTAIFHVSPESGGVERLRIDAEWVSSGAGHGIFVVSADAADDTTKICKNVTYDNLAIENVGSYGIGLQNGDIENVTITNFTSHNTGADGIDFKRRGPNNMGRGITLDNIRVSKFGQRLDGQTGIDVRGQAVLSNIYIGDVGRAGATQSGIRFRTYDAVGDEQADKSTLTNFYVEANTAIGVTCVEVGSPDICVSNGATLSGTTGVWATGNASANADRTLVSNVRSISAGEYGFRVGDADSVTFANCKAISAGIAGFRDTGTNTTYVGCDAPGTATIYSTGTSSAASQMIVGRNGSNYLFPKSASGAAIFEAAGSDTNIDARLDGKGTSGVELRARGARSFRAQNPASATNWVESQGSATGNAVTMSAQGNDTDVDIRVQSKNAGGVELMSRSQRALRASNPASAVNWPEVLGSIAGGPVLITAGGTDADIDIRVAPKGNGRVRVGTHTASADAPITGYIEIKDAGGTVRKLAVIS